MLGLCTLRTFSDGASCSAAVGLFVLHSLSASASLLVCALCASSASDPFGHSLWLIQVSGNPTHHLPEIPDLARILYIRGCAGATLPSPPILCLHARQSRGAAAAHFCEVHAHSVLGFSGLWPLHASSSRASRSRNRSMRASRVFCRCVISNFHTLRVVSAYASLCTLRSSKNICAVRAFSAEGVL